MPRSLSDAEVAAWLATAHRLVAAKLTRAARRELGLQNAPSVSARAAPIHLV